MINISKAHRFLHRTTVASIYNNAKAQSLPAFNNFMNKTSSIYQSNISFNFSTNNNHEDPNSKSSQSGCSSGRRCYSRHRYNTPREDVKIKGLSIDEFKNFIQQKTPAPSTEPKYSSKTIFASTPEMKNFPKLISEGKYKAMWFGMNSLLVGAGALSTYLVYMSPLLSPLTIVPAVYLTYTLFKMRHIQNNIERSVLRLDLVNDKQVKLYTVGNFGKGIVCDIDSAEILKVKEKGRLDARWGRHGGNIAIDTTFKESETNKNIQGKFWVSEDLAVENLSLWRSILQGQSEEVGKFSYEENKEKSV